MNLGQIRTAAYARAGLPSSDSFFDSSTMNSLVNQANAMFESEADWPWLETSATQTLTGGTSTITAPADFLRTITIRVTGSPNELAFRSLTWLDDMATYVGEPNWYGHSGPSIIILPSPVTNRSILHRYIRVAPDLASDSDTPLSPSVFHQAIIEYATYLIHTRQQDDASAEKRMAAYNLWITKAKARAGLESPTAGGGVPLSVANTDVDRAGQA